MANISTITYNGKVIAETEEAGNVVVTYGGKTIANMGAGETKTFSCNGKVMKTNLYIGAKTLLCEMSQMISDVIVAVKSAFPSAPSAYNLIGTYTSNTTWTAPEDGYFQIEVFGASGKGGSCYSQNTVGACGGGGGGGAYVCSRVKMKKGDTIVLVRGAVGSDTTATINSSLQNYSVMKATSGENGETSDDRDVGGAGGYGGYAHGGNYANEHGGDGGDGEGGVQYTNDGAGGVGGAAGYSGGNAGGKGGYIVARPKDYLYECDKRRPGSGKAGFIKIYRGNTNVVA